tara:strand:+ start:4167 stop:4772 length:606 start_codon:yes stop_codon:yes gene_type:complete
MLFSDTYKEIAEDSKATYKEKGSKFISYAFRVYDKNEIKKRIEKLKKTENGANHYCYAYILHPDKSMSRFNDDGEPNSTAGRPILKQIEKNELTNILIVVVRYFGGIKLGIPGLIRSYKTATINVLENTQIIKKLIKEKYTILFKHKSINHVMQVLKQYNLEILNSNFEVNCKVEFLVPKNISENVLQQLTSDHNIKIHYI